MNLGPYDPSEIGRYKILDKLGRGGMGEVYLAQALTPDKRLVAIKVMHPESSENLLISRDRFRREVEAAKLVRGSHTAQILDSDPDAARPWYASEYYPGPTLREAVQISGGGLPYRSIDVLARGLYRALVDIHRRGIVHRDMKPDNVIISPYGPIVIDFGIAHMADRTQLTQKGDGIGTLPYACPEQIRNEDRPQPGWDVFAFGGLLVYALTGQSPFQRDDKVAMMHAILYDPPPTLEGRPEYLRNLILPCLTKDPTERPGLAAIRTLLPGDPMEEVVGTAWLPEQVKERVLEETKKFPSWEPQSRTAPRQTRPTWPERPRSERSTSKPDVKDGIRVPRSAPKLPTDTTGPVPPPFRPVSHPAPERISTPPVADASPSFSDRVAAARQAVLDQAAESKPKPAPQPAAPTPSPKPAPATKSAPEKASLKGFWIYSVILLLIGLIGGGLVVWNYRPDIEQAYGKVKDEVQKAAQDPNGSTPSTVKPTTTPPSKPPSPLPPKPSFAVAKFGKTYVRSSPAATVAVTHVAASGYVLRVSVTANGYGKATASVLAGTCLQIKNGKLETILTPDDTAWDDPKSTSTTNRTGIVWFNLYAPGDYTLVSSCKARDTAVSTAIGRNTLRSAGYLEYKNQLYRVSDVRRAGRNVLVVLPKLSDLTAPSMCVRTPGGSVVRNSALKEETVENSVFYYITFPNVAKGSKLYVSCSVNKAKQPVFSGTSLTLP